MSWSQFKAHHKRGKVYILGIDVCEKASSPFFKSHDFVEIADEQAQQVHKTDAGLFEFSKIVWLK